MSQNKASVKFASPSTVFHHILLLILCSYRLILPSFCSFLSTCSDTLMLLNITIHCFQRQVPHLHGSAFVRGDKVLCNLFVKPLTFYVLPQDLIPCLLQSMYWHITYHFKTLGIFLQSFSILNKFHTIILILSLQIT